MMKPIAFFFGNYTDYGQLIKTQSEMENTSPKTFGYQKMKK